MKTFFVAPVRKWGSSMGVVVPIEIVRLLSLKKNDVIRLAIFTGDTDEWGKLE